MLKGINHVALKVRSLDRAEAFYVGVLELERVGERPGMRFYRAGGGHHDLALVELGEHASRSPGSSLGLFHFCITLSDFEALAALYRCCVDAGVQVIGAVDHNISRGFYVQDPDGNTVELAVDVPASEWRDLENPFARDYPYSLD